MTRLFITAMGPHPSEPGASITGATIRLRHFVTPLIADGHEVWVAMLEDRRRERVALDGVAGAAAFEPAQFCDPVAVWSALGRPEVDAVIGLGSLMPVAAGARMARLLKVPFWADFNGDPLTEWQSDNAFSDAEPDFVAMDHIWKFTRESLLAGDRFSAVSERHASGLLGQLLLLGRVAGAGPFVNRISVIPNAVPSSWAEDRPLPSFSKELTSRGLSPQSPYIFFGGSWTSWMDVQAMGLALNRLMAQRQDLHLVFRGGIESGINGVVRDAFFAALGAVPGNRVHRFAPGEGNEDEMAAHAGTILLLDRDVTESHFGTRNRLLPFVRWGCRPVVSTRSELARDMAVAGIVGGADGGDVHQICEQLTRSLSLSLEERTELRRRGLAFLSQRTYEKTTVPLRAWAAKPDRWPGIDGDSQVYRWARFPADPDVLSDYVEGP